MGYHDCSHAETIRVVMYHTPSEDVGHKFYSNYYRSTINILRKGNYDIYRSSVRIIFTTYNVSLIDKRENDSTPRYYHILFIGICV